MIRPLSPGDARKEHRRGIPDEVLTVVNEHLARGGGKCVTIVQKQLVEEITARFPSLTREALFKNGWLDIEGTYEAAGWSVTYDKPGYCETYDASWQFEPKARRRRAD